MRDVIIIQQSSSVDLLLPALLFAAHGAMAGFALNSQRPLAFLFPTLLGALALVLYVWMHRQAKLAVLDVAAASVTVAPLFTRMVSGNTFNLRNGGVRLIAYPVTRTKVKLRLVKTVEGGGNAIVARLGIIRRDSLPPQIAALAADSASAFGSGPGKL